MNKNFESIKHVDENGIEYWTARELISLLGYLNWRPFEDIINKAIRSALESNQIIENHFGQR